MVDAVVDLLGTITFLDFVQVVFYSSGAESYGTQLVRVHQSTKKSLRITYDLNSLGEAPV